VDQSIWPQQMQVDYVRVYQCAASTQDGKGCGTNSAAAKLVPGYQPPVLGAG